MKKNLNKFIVPIVIISLLNILFEFYMENGSGDIYNYINEKCPDLFRTIVINGVLILIFIGLYKSVKIYYENEINDRDEKLKDNAKIVWEKYQDLYKYKTNEVIMNIIEQFVANNSYVIAVQLYEYSIKPVRRNITMKISYKYGYVSEDNEINSMLQAYYRINRNIYNQYQNSIESNDIDKILNFITKYVEYIKKKPKDKLNEEDVFVFELIILAIEKITINANITSVVGKDIDKKLRELKRTGIVRGILNEDYYLYRNTRENNKKNRIYLTKTLILNGFQHVLLISLDPEMAEFSNVDDFKKLGENFLDLLHNKVEIEYNNI